MPTSEERPADRKDLYIMTKIVSVRFKEPGKAYYFDPNGLDIKRGDKVIAQTSKGVEYAKAVSGVEEIEDDKIVSPLKPIVRIATDEDNKTFEENKKKEKEAYSVCRELIEKHGLDMKLTKVEYAFDGSKIIFFFTADGRVDFRALVRDLVSEFHTRIELRQIGVRDESKMLGGLGMCGRPFCCSTFLNGFHSVSIKMAKDQGLSLSPGKISGTCGRLMCCLQYEENSYEYLNKITPRRGAIVDCKEGRGVVVDSSPLTGMLKIKLNDAHEGAAPVTVNRNEVIVVKK